MTYTQKNIENALETLLVGNIWTSDTLLTITTGEWAMFPSNNTSLVLEQFNVSGVCFKREIVNLTWKSGDILTVTRAYEECVQDDTATPKTITQNALSFNLDQWVVKISQYITAKIIDDIETTIVDIETKLNNFISSLIAPISTGSANAYVVTLTTNDTWYVAWWTYSFITNFGNTWAATVNINGWWAKTIKKLQDQDLASGDIESGQVVELRYDGTVMELVSQIAQVSIPTLNINWLTEKTSLLLDDDEMIVYNSVTAQNEKIKVSNFFKNQNIVYLTRATNAPSWTVTTAHGLWRIPWRIRVKAITPWTTVANGMSFWNWKNDGSNTNGCVYVDVWVSDAATNSTYAIRGYLSWVWQTWVINNVTTSNFNIVFTLAWSPSARSIWIEIDLM